MAYNANTNWANEKKYLNSLISQGGGNASWAKSQMNTLNAAQKQYSTPAPKPTQSTTTAQSNKSSNSNRTTTAPTPTSGNVSYRGDFVNYDDNVDYQARINDAISRGDYASASQFEAQRNAKLYGMGRGNEATTNYVKATPNLNNQGGMIYDPIYNNIGSAPSGWATLATNTGQIYRNDGGSYYLQTGGNSSGPTYTGVGNTYNANTNEFAWNDRGLAEKKALENYAGYGGTGNLNDIDYDYITSLMKGENAKYFNNVASQVQKEERAKKAASVYDYGDSDNSFESEVANVQEVGVPDERDAYLDMIMQLSTGKRTYVY